MREKSSASLKTKIKVTFTHDFTKLLKALKKRFPNVSKDLEPLIEQLEAGETPGYRLQRIAGYEAFKVRVSNRDAQYSMASLRDALAALTTARQIAPLSLDALAHLLSGAMNEAALWIAQAVEPQAALHDAEAAPLRLLEGLRDSK